MKTLRIIAITCAAAFAANAWAQAPSPFAGFKSKMKEGMYEYKMEMDMGQVPGMPPGMGKQSHTMQHCLRHEDIEKGGLGKGRVFVNNQPATVGVLRQLAPELALVHSQGETLGSFDQAQQRMLLDRFGEIATDAVAQAYATWKATAEKTTTPEERGAAKDAALKIFGKDEVALLEHFGVTNRAGFIKALAKIGKMAIQDDTLVPGNAGGSSGARDARAHFPNSNMNP